MISRSWNNSFTRPTSGIRSAGAERSFSVVSRPTSGGQLLVLYSILFWATYLNAPEFVDGLLDYGGRIHRSAWFLAM